MLFGVATDDWIGLLIFFNEQVCDDVQKTKLVQSLWLRQAFPQRIKLFMPYLVTMSLSLYSQLVFQ